MKPMRPTSLSISLGDSHIASVGSAIARREHRLRVEWPNALVIRRFDEDAFRGLRPVHTRPELVDAGDVVICKQQRVVSHAPPAVVSDIQ